MDEVVVTPKAMAGFIQAFFAMHSKDGSGFMTVHDSTTNTDLKLKLRPMETAELTPLGMGIFATCVPMEDASGAVYDVDFMSQKTSRGMDFTEATVHKTPAGTNYEWQKTDRGIWEKKPS